MTIASVPAPVGTPVYIRETPVSAVSWQAVIAGAFVAAAVTLILIALGAGFGLSAVSPWPRSGMSGASFTVTAAIWLVIVQWISAASGGYLTGRLRTRWIGLHTHEVAFRDTAHGFLTWSVATVMGALLLTSAASTLAGGAARTTATVASGAASGAAGSGLNGARDEAVDALFRAPDPQTATPATAETRAETGRLLALGAANGGTLTAGDHDYLVQLVEARTGLSADDSKKRVDAVLAQEKQAEAKLRDAADKARKAAATFAIFLGVSMLVGAFIACAAAALGGLRRDEHA